MLMTYKIVNNGLSVTDVSKATDQEILEFVKAQWQLSDLREINNDNGSLPKNLVEQTHIVLTGTYILQMEKMYDIATSKYKQLQQIRNVSSANIEVTETDKPQAWEPKKKRMLQLHLTDGIQDVTAIEYNTMTSLNNVLLPGFKVMIIGPVKCLRGVILLEEGRFKEVGGEVESLLIPNAMENVLARALNLPENPDPYNDNNQPLVSTNIHSLESTNCNFNSNNSNYNCSETKKQDQVKQEMNQDSFFEDEFEINLDEVSIIERESQEFDEKVKKRCVSSNIDDKTNENKEQNKEGVINKLLDLNDDFLEIIDENELILPSTSTGIRSSTVKNHTMTPMRVLPREVNNQQKVHTCNTTTKRVTTPNFTKDQGEKFTVTNAVQFLEDDFDFSDFDTVITDSKNTATPTKQNSNTANCNVQCKNNSASSKSSSTLTKTTNSTTFQSDSWKLMNNTSSVPSETTRYKNDNVTITTPAKITKTKSHSGSSKALGNKRPAALVSPPILSPPKVRCIQESPKHTKGDRKISDFLKVNSKKDDSLEPAPSKVHSKRNNSPEPTPPKICDFICDVIEEIITDVTFRTVRGQVTMMGKLSKKDSCWILEGTITDGTASMDVTFASELLERLLGFTVKEFSEKKKLRKTNPEIEQELRMGCRSAEQRLNTLDALLELELLQNRKPKVINITYLTIQQKQVFDRRLKMLTSSED